MANFVYIATSLDGFIARKDGNIDWLFDIPNPTKSDFGYAEFIKDIHAIVMGRNTFEKVLSFESWPYTRTVFVLSEKLSKVPPHLSGKVQILKGNAKDIIQQLNSEGFSNLYIDGGKTIQQFLKAGLIDEMIITRVPIILGDGIPLFSLLKKEIRFIHLKTEIFDNGLVKTHYRKN